MNNICKICNKKFDKIRGLSVHLNMYHNITILDYYIKYENFKIPKCPHCNKNCKKGNGIFFFKTCGNKNCISKLCSLRKHTDETKQKISKNLKKLYENGERKSIGWSFINEDINRRSYPEIYFIKILEKYNLYSKYTIKEKMSFGKYFLDFAILDLKIDIEIDGQQHFTEKSINHDNKRDNFVISKGWKVYRIAWIELKNNSELIINNFLNWIYLNEKLYHKYDVNDVIISIKKNENKKIHGSSDDYHKFVKNNLIIKNKPKIDLVLNSNIDFSKLGWVKKVSVLINIKHQKVNEWMKLYMNDFYQTNCFKRRFNEKTTQE